MIRTIDATGKYAYRQTNSQIEIIGFGESLDEAFEHIGIAMCETVVPLATIASNRTKKMSVTGESITRALYEYLNILLFEIREERFMIKHIYYLAVTRTDSGDFKITCELVGEDNSPHVAKFIVSKVHHVGMRLELITDSNGYEVAVFFSVA